jgi:hypothetical protein
MLAYVKAYGRAVRWLYDTGIKGRAVDILIKYSNQDRKDSVDTYDYFVTKLEAFGKATYKNMTNGPISLNDMTPALPPISKFVDASYVQEAWKYYSDVSMIHAQQRRSVRGTFSVPTVFPFKTPQKLKTASKGTPQAC